VLMFEPERMLLEIPLQLVNLLYLVMVIGSMVDLLGVVVLAGS